MLGRRNEPSLAKIMKTRPKTTQLPKIYEQRSDYGTKRQETGRFMTTQKRIYHKLTPLIRYSWFNCSRFFVNWEDKKRAGLKTKKNSVCASDTQKRARVHREKKTSNHWSSLAVFNSSPPKAFKLRSNEFKYTWQPEILSRRNMV